MAKKKLYLHIGRHKTGTSSLQQFFVQNADQLAEHGILYPETGRKKNPLGTLQIAHHDFSRTLRFKTPDEIRVLLSTLEAEAKDFSKILLSSEDFQNQRDFSKLSEIFSNYELVIIGYLREGLSYHLSSYAQRVHYTSDIFSIRQFVEAQNIPIDRFVKDWSQLGSESIFRLYERSKLKNGDIVDDFLDIINIGDIDKSGTVHDSNPSLSGNLLSLKLLLNLIGQSQIAPYESFGEAAALDPTFGGKIYVSDRVARQLRELTDYNAVLKSIFPDFSEPSLENGSRLFDLSRWDQDMDLISSLPELAFAQTLKLGALGRILENNRLSVDTIEAEFPTAEMIDAIQLPNRSFIQNLRESAKTAIRDADKARKDRAQLWEKFILERKISQETVAKKNETISRQAKEIDNLHNQIIQLQTELDGTDLKTTSKHGKRLRDKIYRVFKN